MDGSKQEKTTTCTAAYNGKAIKKTSPKRYLYIQCESVHSRYGARSDSEIKKSNIFSDSFSAFTSLQKQETWHHTYYKTLI